MVRKIFVAAIAMAFYVSSFAQATADSAAATKEPEEKKPFLTITGSADVYYRYDFAKTKANNLTSFTNTQNAFALGMASVKLEHKSDKVGFVADLGFGQRAKDFA